MPTQPPYSGTNDPLYYNDSGGTSTGSSNGSGYGNNYIGNYSNLPNGISNAGDGRSGSNAYTRQVQPNELASYQLNGLLASDSPYIQQAQQAGLDVSNDRGLLNSSIAAGNSERSAIQAGLPIAQQDAATYGTAAGQNLDALNTILATRMNNTTSMRNAAAEAGAQRYAADQGLLNNRENRTFEGQQAGINRNFQDYMTQQGFGNQMRLQGMQIGGNLLEGSQQFNQNLFLQASQNPFMIQNPQALQGYSDFANGPANQYIDQIFGYSLNGGNNLPQWQENSNWYQSPDYSQQYGDGNYVGGGPQLPYQQEPYNAYYSGGY